jgi:hypothetical protein
VSEFGTLECRDMLVPRVSPLSATDAGRDLVVLAAGELSVDGEDTLVNEGWEVRRVTPINNPGTWTGSSAKRFPPRFWAVYTKLLIFNLTDYNTGARPPLAPVRFTADHGTWSTSDTAVARWQACMLTGPCAEAKACAGMRPQRSVKGLPGTLSVETVTC